jgi:putative hydrolase of HD superfamily
MLPKQMIQRIFSTANMRRWSDLATMVDFFELDKQALKAVYIYIIAKYQEDSGSKIDWVYLIEGHLFEFFKRATLTDIKPQVYHKLISQKNRELNEFFLSIFEEEIDNDLLYEKCKSYYTKNSVKPLEDSILKVSHILSTKWEYDFIDNNTKELYSFEDIKSQLDNSLKEYIDLVGVKELLFNSDLKKFIHVVSSLRFQTRWSNIPRIPKTSVLGHTLIVAMLSYIFSLELKYCDKMIYNNFFDGIFHDLAEALTRDIISPIKYSIDGLDEILKEYEKELIQNQILTLLPSFFHDDIINFTLHEFDNTSNGKIVDDDISNYNQDSKSAKDGKMLKICDKLSAYYEASISIEYGVSPKELKSAKDMLQQSYKNTKYFDLDLERYFSIF